MRTILLTIFLAFFALSACQSGGHPDSEIEENLESNNIENPDANASNNMSDNELNQNNLEENFNTQNNFNTNEQSAEPPSNTNPIANNGENAAKPEPEKAGTEEAKKDPAVRPEDEAETNKKAFHGHFQNLFAGHPEGNFVVRSKTGIIYDDANDKAQIVGYLQAGDLVHGISQIDDFVQIGVKKYVERRVLQNYGARTPGSEPYHQPKTGN